MTYHISHARTALTAIAAVLALTSTPSMAQDSPPPVADAAPDPVAPPADPLAPAETDAAPAAKAAPAKAKATSTARRTASRPVARTAARSEPASAVVTEAAPPAPPPVETAVAPPVAPGAVPVAEPAAPPLEQAPTTPAIDMDQALPIAGGTALGLLLLGGVAAARRRKRRKQELADEEAKMAFIEASEQEHQQHPIEPAFVRAPPRHDPVPVRETIAAGAATTLPNGFDLSRFGRHVQAAYRGPTEENPSLSLKHRLRRAGFMDQQERREDEMAGTRPAAETVAGKPVAEAPATIPAKGNWESRNDADFLFYRAGTKPDAKPALHDQ